MLLNWRTLKLMPCIRDNWYKVEDSSHLCMCLCGCVCICVFVVCVQMRVQVRGRQEVLFSISILTSGPHAIILITLVIDLPSESPEDIINYLGFRRLPDSSLMETMV